MRYQDLSKTITPKNFPGRSKITIQIWYIVLATLFRLSPHVFFGWRNLLLRIFGAKIGRSVKIKPSCTVTYPWNVEIGDHTYIADEVVIYSLGKIKIGCHVSLSYRSFLCGGTHNHRKFTFDLITKNICIEDEAWLATDCFIHPGVTVGRGSIISAKTVVHKDVPDGKIVKGFPMEIVGDRLKDINQHND